ncbi:ubiquitin-conjugating enzyme [Penicillium lagena]|uniref:ubiquitin-conjugating enzyme n=1 Tax=Penicillium lagena TaxID=94218 RepID=UPI00253F9A83|nr:ubiquitin-conjugating enzyme [Penicillium lagena]KAJ5625751.1 ubiquitin-conjugating enzyme [Penicillium lagena]
MDEVNGPSGAPDAQLDVGDAVHLRVDPRRRGYVIVSSALPACSTHHNKVNTRRQRTYANAPGRLSHANRLILKHTDVSEADLKDFIYTNTPKEGYVFVSFANVAQGYALIKESDLELIDRPLRAGAIVHRGKSDSVHGTVLNATRTLDLESIMVRVPGAPPNEPTFQDQGVVGTTPTSMWRIQLHDIPAKELRGYDEFNRDDFVLINEKLAVIEKISCDCFVQLVDGTVTKVPHDAKINACDAFAIPTTLSQSALVASPTTEEQVKMSVELQPGVWYLLLRPDSLHQLHPGQRILGSPDVFRALPFLKGRFHEDIIQQHNFFECNILGLVPAKYQVRWICTNPFLAKVPRLGPLREQITADAFHSRAHKVLPGSRHMDKVSGCTVMAPADYCVGAHVIFRNMCAAGAKYPDMGVFPTIFGNDLNVYTVTATKTRVHVLWEDGSQTTESSKDLCVGIAPESHEDEEDILMPGSLVAAISGISESMIPREDKLLSLWLGKDLTNDKISCKKVGVVQKIQNDTQTANVRWFEEPHVELFQGGSILDMASIFGDLEDKEHTVSLDYLEMYSALNRRVGDLIIFAPPRVSQGMIDNASGMSNIPDVGFCHLEFLFPVKLADITEYVSSLRVRLVAQKWFLDSTMIEAEDPLGISGVYFLAQITRCNLDGTLTIEPLGDYGVYGKSHYDFKIDQERALLAIPRDTGPGLCFDDMEETPSGSGDGHGDRGSNGVYSLTDVSYSSSDYDEDHIERNSAILSPGGAGYEADESDLSGDDDFVHPSRDELLQELAQSVLSTFSLNIEESPSAEQTATTEQQLTAVSAASESQAVPVGSSDDEEQAQNSSFGLDGVSETISDIPSNSPDSELIIEGIPGTPYSPSKVPDYSESFKNIPSRFPDAFSVLDGEPPKNHHFIDQPQALPEALQRLHWDFSILRTSLPSDIFVRTWESHMDLLQVLIFGPKDTPYEFVPFFFDIYLGGKFPNEPPEVFFHNWKNATYDINPNFDPDSGHVCLSLLGTWMGSATERWSRDSTILQLVVSIQGLVLVKHPFYNETAWEYMKSDGNDFEFAKLYHEKVYLACRSQLCHMDFKRIPGFEDVLVWYYVPDPDADSDDDDFPNNPTRRPNYLHKAAVSLKRVINFHSISMGTRILFGLDIGATEFMEWFSKEALEKMWPLYKTLREIERKAVTALDAGSVSAGEVDLGLE